MRPAVLYGWVRDTDSLDTSSINAEEVEQLDSLLTAQDELKKSIRVCLYNVSRTIPHFLTLFHIQKMAEKLDIDRGVSIR